jgi:hypothetical protein
VIAKSISFTSTAHLMNNWGYLTGWVCCVAAQVLSVDRRELVIGISVSKDFVTRVTVTRMPVTVYFYTMLF